MKDVVGLILLSLLSSVCPSLSVICEPETQEKSEINHISGVKNQENVYLKQSNFI